MLQELRRLRQGEEPAGVRAARNQVVPRALGRGPGEYRRFQFHEAVVIEESANRPRNRMAQSKIALHLLAPEVKIAVAEPQFLPGVLLVVKGRGLCPVENPQFSGLKLHFPGGQVRIDRALRPLAHTPADREHILAAYAFGLGKDIRIGGVENHLQQPLAIPQIDEDYAAVIAPPMHPAGDGDLLADMGAVHETAVVAAHGVQPSAAST